MMRKRQTFNALVIILALLLVAGTSLAQQQPPPHLDRILADLGIRVGRTVTVNALTRWRYIEQNFNDASLGCPQPGGVYAQVQTPGYQFVITYGGQIYDYRISADQRALVMCGTTPAPAETPPCPPADDTRFLPPRLEVGMQAQVGTEGLPNNMRDIPGTSGRLLGEIPAGGIFTVVDGPQCGLVDALVWWQVDYEGLVGWTAEGRYDNSAPDYWLEPLFASGLPLERLVPLTAQRAASIIELRAFPQVGPVTDLAWSPNGLTLATAGTDGVWVYDMTTNDLTPRQIAADATAAIAFAPDGRTLFAVSPAGSLTRWSVETGDLQAVLRTVESPSDGTLPPATVALALSPDGSRLLIGGQSGVDIFDATSGLEMGKLGAAMSFINTIAFSPDLIKIAVGGVDGILRLYDGVNAATVTEVLAGGAIADVTFSPDGRVVYVAGGSGATFRLFAWDVASNSLLWSVPAEAGGADFTREMALSPDGSLLAMGMDAGMVRLWRTNDATPIGSLTMASHVVAFNPNGTFLATATPRFEETPNSAAVRVWGVLNGA